MAHRHWIPALYDAACFLLSPAEGGRQGVFAKPDKETPVVKFAASPMGHVAGYTKLGQNRNKSGL